MVKFENGITPLSAENLNKLQSDLLEVMFPVGSTYITQVNTNPNEILGFGFWERIKGKVCVGLDETDTDFDTIGKTGGNKAHNHKQKFNFVSDYVTSNGLAYTAGGTVPTGEIYTENASNMQPYEVVGYMWIRRG